MRKFLAFILIIGAAKSALAGVSIGGGSASSKTLLDLASTAFNLESLPSVHIDSEILRRAEARLSVEGIETIDIPVAGTLVQVRKLSSSLVDASITKRFTSE